LGEREALWFQRSYVLMGLECGDGCHGFPCGASCIGETFVPIIAIVTDEVSDLVEGLVHHSMLEGHGFGIGGGYVGEKCVLELSSDSEVRVPSDSRELAVSSDI
jgi:hypothetical protein